MPRHLTPCNAFEQMVDEDISRLAAPRFVPMLVQPRDWTQPDRGGFLKLHTQIMRTRGEAVQKQALRRADLTRVYQGLNCLGKVAALLMRLLNAMSIIIHRCRGVSNRVRV